MSDGNERYPMCDDQPAQIDCRMESCKYHSDGSCNNVSPAITLNPDGKWVCWSSYASKVPEQKAKKVFWKGKTTDPMYEILKQHPMNGTLFVKE